MVTWGPGVYQTAADNDVALYDSVLISAFSEQAQAEPTADIWGVNATTSVGFDPDVQVDDGSSLSQGSTVWGTESRSDIRGMLHKGGE